MEELCDRRCQIHCPSRRYMLCSPPDTRPASEATHPKRYGSSTTLFSLSSLTLTLHSTDTSILSFRQILFQSHPSNKPCSFAYQTLSPSTGSKSTHCTQLLIVSFICYNVPSGGRQFSISKFERKRGSGLRGAV